MRRFFEYVAFKAENENSIYTVTRRLFPSCSGAFAENRESVNERERRKYRFFSQTFSVSTTWLATNEDPSKVYRLPYPISLIRNKRPNVRFKVTGSCRSILFYRGFRRVLAIYLRAFIPCANFVENKSLYFTLLSGIARSLIVQFYFYQVCWLYWQSFTEINTHDCKTKPDLLIRINARRSMAMKSEREQPLWVSKYILN